MIAENSSLTIGQVRIQALSPTLLRLEQKGPAGFEDRVTFSVVDRDWPGVEVKARSEADRTIFENPAYRVSVPAAGANLAGVRVESTTGELFFQCTGEAPPLAFLPAPAKMPGAWVLPDSPRLIPSERGAALPPDAPVEDPTSGWDTGNMALDLYIFVPGAGGYRQLCRDFLKLTGPVPMPPLYTFGLMDSRYHPYSEETALEGIDTYRQKRIPLDLFVLDTDWRMGASHGYGTNKELFPDMRRFLQQAHERHVFVMFNDHPEPQAKTALAPAELKFRYEGLASLLAMGADVWWYDRNWRIALHDPVPGLDKEVWGMRLFHDITEHFRPERRPLIMSNVQGITNGYLESPSSPAAHRFPIWWTGDTRSEWDALRKGVRNGVNGGADSLLPYVHEDLGGHHGDPLPELYVRFVQYGALSPIMRLHCSAGHTRFPWDFGEEAECVATDYIRLRYRLLPMIYAAAHRTYQDGSPLLRRCDLEWPTEKEAANPDQYLFGDDLLVAPVLTGENDYSSPLPAFLRAADDSSGLDGSYFANTNLDGERAAQSVDAAVDFNWGKRSAPHGLSPEGFSVCWTGLLADLPETGEYSIGLHVSGEAKLWLNGKLHVQVAGDLDGRAAMERIRLHQGGSVEVRIEFRKSGPKAQCRLIWITPSVAAPHRPRSVWIPPGAWRDAWTGAVLTGPKKIDVNSPLWHMPMFVRDGGIVLSIPAVQYTGETPWSEVIVDAFVPASDGTVTRELYEDDALSPEYQRGACASTPLTLERRSGAVRLGIGQMNGHYSGALAERRWVVRLHLPAGVKPGSVTLNAAILPLDDEIVRLISPAAKSERVPFGGKGAAPGAESGSVLEIRLPTRPTSSAGELSVSL